MTAGHYMTALAFMYFGKVAVQGAFNILYIFTSELYPTVIRNTAVGFTSMVARFGSGLPVPLDPLEGPYPFQDAINFLEPTKQVNCMTGRFGRFGHQKMTKSISLTENPSSNDISDLKPLSRRSSAITRRMAERASVIYSRNASRTNSIVQDIQDIQIPSDLKLPDLVSTDENQFKNKLSLDPFDSSSILFRGKIASNNSFKIDYTEAGAGMLSIKVEGPSVARYTDHKDGSIHVQYKVTIPREYRVIVKYNNVDIPNSPFKAVKDFKNSIPSDVSVGKIGQSSVNLNSNRFVTCNVTSLNKCIAIDLFYKN